MFLCFLEGSDDFVSSFACTSVRTSIEASSCKFSSTESDSSSDSPDDKKKKRKRKDKKDRKVVIKNEPDAIAKSQKKCEQFMATYAKSETKISLALKKPLKDEKANSLLHDKLDGALDVVGAAKAEMEMCLTMADKD